MLVSHGAAVTAAAAAPTCCQDSPGQALTLDPLHHVEVLVTYLLSQQHKDYQQLCGSRGMHK